MTSLTRGFEQFESKLFLTISQENHGQNVFLSPTSIALALSMCTVGAQNETLQQMLQVFGISSKEELTHIAEQIMQVFSRANQNKSSTKECTNDFTSLRPRASIETHMMSFQLQLVNRLYVQKGYKTQEKYLDRIEQSFQSNVKLEDFQNNSANVVQKINTWVEEQTNGRICNTLSTKDVTSDTRFVLINCIYFKGEWQDKFQATNTDKNANFYHANGVISKIELMYKKESYNYVDNKDLHVQIAHLPYRSSDQYLKFVFTVVLPYEGIELNNVERILMSNPKLRQQVLNMESAPLTDLSLYLPKFKLETKYELKDILISLGMKDAFSDRKADFKDIIGTITDENRICISKVIHKTFLNVNESGTEAAAAAVVMLRRYGSSFSSRSSSIEFKANRPFLFFIHEVQQNVLLFNGKFVSP
ncbi:unnamed protein product [Rotaria sp. Silwood1]|nr:unnamed protein product [Rotaria sp. Silwood1]CAF1144760.1 unnamed protein product [Rotaria sp. Silwood1]CAF3429806.1 unnamed protein product [Rotaria sp. Silwood1]CAF3451489.1 unnamed protein product [Rotaria sp. Silwood1]CAF4777588.1 unnamed protein product [Rotaria sp. Silwood1]